MNDPILKNGAAPQEAAPGTDQIDTDVTESGESIKEFSWRHKVTTRTAIRWIAAGKLNVRHTPGENPRIFGVRT